MCGGQLGQLRKWIYFFYIKRCDAKNMALLGADMNAGAKFASHPKFPHGINGIIISSYATIGKNAYIYHQITIGDDSRNYRNVATIGDNVVIGAGAKIIGKVTIGHNVILGAGAIVVEDVPSGAIVVGPKARIIVKDK